MFAAFIRPLLSVVLTLAEAQRLPDKAYDGRAFDPVRAAEISVAVTLRFLRKM